MSNLTEYARSEMQRAGLFDKDSDYGGMLAEVVMKMVELFSEEGHSGASGSMAISIFSKVAAFEPLTPLTGEDDEWVECTHGFEAHSINDPDGQADVVVKAINQPRVKRMWQNKRCSRVFKGEDGRAYDIEGKIFRHPDGLCYTNRESRVYITFPYVPKHEYVDVDY